MYPFVESTFILPTSYRIVKCLYLYVTPEQQQTYAPVNEWNHYKIRSVGDTLETWVNGRYVGKFVDHGRAFINDTYKVNFRQ